jgi:AraC-like DNA-binding protein
MDQRVVPPAGIAQLSTDAVPQAQRDAFWVDMVCRHLIAIDCEPAQNAAGFHGDIAMRSIGAVDVSQLASCAQRVTRTAPLLAEADGDYFLLNIQRSHRSVLRQDGREALLAPGDAALYSSNRAYQLDFDGGFEQTVMVLPAAPLRALCPSIDRMTAVGLKGGQPLVDLLAATAHAYFGTPFEQLPANCARHAEQALIETVAGCVSAHAGQAEAARSTLAQFHLNRIRQYVQAHLGDNGLSVQQVGAALSLSASHIHRLFEAQELSFGAWLWECRLQACSRALRQPAYARLPISQVAYRCGFSHAAHFSRAFRARFGVTAREWRAQAAGEG